MMMMMMMMMMMLMLLMLMLLMLLLLLLLLMLMSTSTSSPWSPSAACAGADNLPSEARAKEGGNAESEGDYLQGAVSWERWCGWYQRRVRYVPLAAAVVLTAALGVEACVPVS